MNKKERRLSKKKKKNWNAPPLPDKWFTTVCACTFGKPFLRCLVSVEKSFTVPAVVTSSRIEPML